MALYRHLNASRPCPMCGWEKFDLLYEQFFSMLSSDSLLGGYDVVACTNCGFGFANYIPQQLEFDRYYRDMSKYEFQDSGGKESIFDAKRFDAIADLIKQFIQNPRASVLDVGCATGGLLHRVRQRGFEKITGIDPSPACASMAWSKYQIPVLAHTISQIEESNEKFDFIILVGVLEHIRDLTQHLEVIRKILTRYGRIFIEVPDALRFFEWPDAPYQQFSMEHINFFSPASLRNLLSATGFRILQMVELTREQSLGTIMPVVAVVAERADVKEKDWGKCEETDPALKRYIVYSQKVESRIRRIMTDLANSKTQILVWGTGTHTLHLLENSDLKRVNIAAFVDSNPRYQNKGVNGVPVIAPAKIRDYSLPILVSSRVFQNDIVEQIRKTIGAQNELILLYDDV